MKYEGQQKWSLKPSIVQQSVSLKYKSGNEKIIVYY